MNSEWASPADLRLRVKRGLASGYELNDGLAPLLLTRLAAAAA